MNARATRPNVDTNVDAAGKNARATVAGRGWIAFGGPEGRKPDRMLKHLTLL